MDNKDKYDRQIRLWGVDGQKEIQNAVLVSLGSGVISAEFLKNLVLHAVGTVVIIDDSIVTEEDVGINFFVEKQYIGQYRADVLAKLLKEMNPDPVFKSIISSPFDLNVFKENSFGESAIVVTTGNIQTQFLNDLSDVIRSQRMRQVHIQSTGLFSSMYIDAGKHYFFEGGVENKDPNDFRISKPFPELVEFFESFKFDSMDDNELGNLPYLVILYHARKRLKIKKNFEKIGSKNRKELISEILSMKRYEAQENISLAIDNASFAYDDVFPPINTVEAFDVVDQFDEKHPFWETIRACKNFFQKNGVIPHYGGMPDIECSPDLYKAMKELYKAKSIKDWAEIAAEIPDVPKDIISHISKCIWRIGGVNYQKLSESIQAKTPKENIYSDATTHGSIIQILFIAARQFIDQYGRNPGRNDIDVMSALMKSLDAEDNYSDLLTEFCTYEGETIPCVAAFFSGIAAQEITKIIIRQATPINGTFFYDGVHTSFHSG